jgi:hypothetical protein
MAADSEVKSDYEKMNTTRTARVCMKTPLCPRPVKFIEKSYIFAEILHNFTGANLHDRTLSYLLVRAGILVRTIFYEH